MKIKQMLGFFCLLALTLALAPVKAEAAAPEVYQVRQDALAYVAASVPSPTVASSKGEWAVLAMARGGIITPEVKAAYLNNLAAYAENCGGALDTTPRQAKHTEYSRVVVAMTSIGQDASNFKVGDKTYDFIAPLLDNHYQQVAVQGVNGPSWALIALDCGGYLQGTPEGNAARAAYIESIMAKKLPGGGVSFSTTAKTPDVSLTAMAVEALAPYYLDRARFEALGSKISYAELQDMVDGSLKALSAVQKTTGSCGNSGNDVEVVVALTALGRNPATDPLFVKDGVSVLDGLLSYYDSEAHGFKLTATAKAVNQMATEQGAYALVAYDRFLADDANALYDMSDVFVASPSQGEPEYLLTAIGGGAAAGGTLEPLGQIKVPAGASQTIKVVPDDGCVIKAVWLDGVSGEAVTEYTFKDIDANHTIYADFGYPITVEANQGGSVTPAGGVTIVAPGKNQQFTITADEGYIIKAVLVDDEPVELTARKVSNVLQPLTKTGTYTFSKVAAGHTLKVTFAEEGEEQLKPEQPGPEQPKPEQPEQPPVVNPPAGGGTTTDTIKVYFTLLGDTPHGVPSNERNTHTLKKKNLTTWIARNGYQMAENATVREVLEKALTEAGLTWRNPSGNYVEAITYNGITLGEFDNGSNSGWKYTLNGEYPEYGIDEQTLVSGDVIVFHYTDDFSLEKDGEQWSGSSNKGTGSNAGSIVLTPGTVENSSGQNTAAVTANEISKAINSAKNDSLTNIVIEPVSKGSVDNILVSLPVDSAKAIADAKMGLNLNSKQGSLAIPEAALQAIAAQAGGVDVRLNVASQDLQNAQVQASVGSALQQAAAELRGTEASVTEITISSDKRSITSFDGHSLTVSLPVRDASRDKFSVGESYKVVVLSADGAVETLIGKCAKYNGQLVVQVQINHLSTFIVTTETAQAAKAEPTSQAVNFADVQPEDWFYEAVQFVAGAGLMQGEEAGHFQPGANLNRAMLVTILYRLAEPEAAAVGDSFADVEAGSWYADAVNWASANQIVNGYADNRFAPMQNISREEMAAMLMRYAEYMGYDVSATQDLARYSDGGQVSEWAKAGLQWAGGCGLLKGDESNRLNPQGQATRAEAAMLLLRFCGNIAK